MTIPIKTLGPDDISLVLSVAPGVFDRTPQRSLTAEFLNDPRHHLVVALDERRIVGFVSAVHYVHPDKAAELFINEVGVASSHRDIGIGRQLLHEMLSIAGRLGCRNAWVLTDPTNISARRLYESVGGVEAPGLQMMFEFPIEPGKQA